MAKGYADKAKNIQKVVDFKEELTTWYNKDNITGGYAGT